MMALLTSTTFCCCSTIFFGVIEFYHTEKQFAGVNGDGKIDLTDVLMLVDYIMGVNVWGHSGFSTYCRLSMTYYYKVQPSATTSS